MPYMIRSACLTDYVAVSRSVGIDPFRLLNQAGLPRACLSDADMMIPAGAVGRLLEASARAAGIDDFGLRLAEMRSLSNLGPVGLIVREQPTIRRAIEALIRYIGLHNQSLSLRVEESGDLVILSPALVVSRPAPIRQAVELSMGVLYRILRLFLGDAWKAHSVSFTHPAPKRREAHRRFFGARVEFGQDFNGIVCLARDLEAPIPAADPTMARYVQRYLDSIAARPNASLRETVRELIWMILPTEGCSIERVAARLGTNRRTLHRHLRREGATYSGLIDAVRTEMVTHYLENREQPLQVVADMLGFSALSVFSRWFRSRFGCSVSAWRAAHQSGLPHPPARPQLEAAARGDI